MICNRNSSSKICVIYYLSFNKLQISLCLDTIFIRKTTPFITLLKRSFQKVNFRVLLNDLIERNRELVESRTKIRKILFRKCPHCCKAFLNNHQGKCLIKFRRKLITSAIQCLKHLQCTFNCCF